MKKTILGALALIVVVGVALVALHQIHSNARTPLATVAVADLEKTVTQSNTPVFVLLTAPNCQNCAQLESMLERSASKFAGKMTFVKVDISKDADLSKNIPADKLPVFTIVDPELGQVTPLISGMPKSQESLDTNLLTIIDAIAKFKEQHKNAPADDGAPQAPAQPSGK